ncbi:MAG: hypothetical protein ABGZ17_32220 [Planctomycetaceae bacterium]
MRSITATLWMDSPQAPHVKTPIPELLERATVFAPAQLRRGC